MKLSSVLNFPYYLFGFKGVSRSFTHQWVRYRLAAHMQQSLRYVEIKPDGQWFVIPLTVLKKGSDAIVDYINHQQKSARQYLDLLKKGVPAEDARFVLPQGTETHISTAMNAEELLHVFCQRCCTEAQWEIRKGAYALATAMMLISPNIFYDLGPYCKQDGICRGGKKGACKPVAEDLLKVLKKIVDSKRDEFDALVPGDEIIIDLTEILGHRVDDKVKEEVEKKLGWKPNLDYEVKIRVVKR
jgi:thymidylate synthase (FAD)